MPTTATPTREDTRIRERIDSTVQAIRTKDINALMAHYAPSTVTFDFMPLQMRGVDPYRKNFEDWFGAVEGPIDFEIRDLRVSQGDDTAFCHYLGHVKGTRKQGGQSDYWVRVTTGFQKVKGEWMVTHEHVSVPFVSMEAMEAALAAGRSTGPE